MQSSGEAVPRDTLGGLFEDMLAEALSGWEGLRLYVTQRRGGAPADPTLEILLRERLRLAFGDDADLGAIIERCLASPAG